MFTIRNILQESRIRIRGRTQFSRFLKQFQILLIDKLFVDASANFI